MKISGWGTPFIDPRCFIDRWMIERVNGGHQWCSRHLSACHFGILCPRCHSGVNYKPQNPLSWNVTILFDLPQRKESVLYVRIEHACREIFGGMKLLTWMNSVQKLVSETTAKFQKHGGFELDLKPFAMVSKKIWYH